MKNSFQSCKTILNCISFQNAHFKKLLLCVKLCNCNFTETSRISYFLTTMVHAYSDTNVFTYHRITVFYSILQKIDKLISKLKICVYFSKQNCIKPRRKQTVNLSASMNMYIVKPLIKIINSKCDTRKTIVICMYNVHVSFSDKQFHNH